MDLASGSRNYAYQLRLSITECHEVDQPGRSTFSFKFSLEDQRSVTITPANSPGRFGGGN